MTQILHLQQSIAALVDMQNRNKEIYDLSLKVVQILSSSLVAAFFHLFFS